MECATRCQGTYDMSRSDEEPTARTTLSPPPFRQREPHAAEDSSVVNTMPILSHNANHGDDPQ